MMGKKRWVFLMLLAVLFSLSACGGGVPDGDWELTVSGDVANPLALSLKDLAAMEQVDLSEVLMEKSTGEDEVTSWSGVPLADLLEQAGAGEFSTITAVAGDGYAIEISVDELDNAIVALKDQGEWIAEVTPDKGPLRLVTPETPGNRWVFQLLELQVNR
jgi:DMSO/TMAO reductase YedYZ molybdopterin-dependent catalytic subunit